MVQVLDVRTHEAPTTPGPPRQPEDRPEPRARVLQNEMVIRHYAKFIPNLTRRDGSALARVMREQGL
jgi:hypothetical protein